MAKLILNGVGQQSNSSIGTIQDTIVPPNPFYPNQEVESINGQDYWLRSGCYSIEVQNNHTLTIQDNQVHLNSILVTSGTITLNNNYIGKNQTAITIGDNSTLTLTGRHLPINKVN